MRSRPFCSANMKQMGYLEPTSFALVEKGQQGNEDPPPPPPAVQHWVALISQFTLCFAASLGTMRYEVIVAAASAFSTYRPPVKSREKEIVVPNQDVTRSKGRLLLIIWILGRKKQPFTVIDAYLFKS